MVVTLGDSVVTPDLSRLQKMLNLNDLANHNNPLRKTQR